MSDITRADILGAINVITGNPSVGVVHDVTPAIVDAMDKLINGKPAVEQRVVKPTETRKADAAE